MKNPEFTEVSQGEATENQEDSEQILKNQDQTDDLQPSNLDENMGARSMSVDAIEDESEDFMQGEVDVATQMDRAARHIKANVTGHGGNA